MNEKQKTITIIGICIFSFMMGYFLNSVILSQDTDIWNKTPTVQTGIILTWTETKWNSTTTGKATWTVVLNKQPNLVKKTTTTWNKVVYKKPTQPVLGVSAWYKWESTYERVRNQLIKLWLTYDVAEHITWEAYTNTQDPKLFVKSIVWVSMAEWWVFKRWLYNNYLWVMSRKSDWTYSLRRYETIQLAISDWREMYNRNKWYVRTTWQARLNWNYCASACLSWVSNYNAGITLLNI
jgi:hypothetical protein